ncbi:MAG TPA: UDP-N-acetylmuramoyl-L-alanyl-D-glutamate--2,6-diaminopimelate ligase [Candidatus Binatia bacterium]|nr:UDP-N-acetylmuramoyl-L-alanyl-D-glutamate--2,6-diaminopimelate ligase [Candidatus Binatia bacterium]
MRLRELLALDKIEAVDGDGEREIKGLAYDSRQVERGFVFFAIRGEKWDGHEFVEEAAGRGAAALVVGRAVRSPGATVVIRVPDVRRTMALWSAHFYGEPSRALKLVGITGTNGKTTCSYLIEAILAVARMAPGVIGTINYRYAGQELPSHHTTPESLDLQRLLSEMLHRGARAGVLEVSSHALAQERVRGLQFDAALFTNLSRDHLDYHADMDDYFAAKSKLFTDHLAHSAKPKRSAIVYAGDPRGAELVKMLNATDVDVWTYGEDSHCDVHPVQVLSDVTGIRGQISVKGRALEFSSAMIGAANLQNILGATAVGCALGLPSDVIAAGIRSLTTVPGRLEKVENGRGFSVLVDYAHTPDALEKVLATVRPLAQRRVFAVFGCGGDRDRGKRPVMGEIAARLSDIAIVTSDNPRTEEPGSIIAEIEGGLRCAGKASVPAFKAGTENSKLESENGYYVEADRRAAIRIALASARPGDVVLIAGKGHEDYQIIGTEKTHFDDREVAREELARL